jgi:Holliday junction resolvase
MNASRLGKIAEKKVRDDLLAAGYTIVTSKLSRGPADLIAAKMGQSLAVQVKRMLGGSPRPAEWNELVDLAEAFGSVPVVAFAPPRCSIIYKRIIGRKAEGWQRQPWVDLVLDEVGAA